MKRNGTTGWPQESAEGANLLPRNASESSATVGILECGDLSPLCLRRLVADAARPVARPGKRRQVGALHMKLVAASARWKLFLQDIPKCSVKDLTTMNQISLNKPP